MVQKDQYYDQRREVESGLRKKLGKPGFTIVDIASNYPHSGGVTVTWYDSNDSSASPFKPNSKNIDTGVPYSNLEKGLYDETVLIAIVEKWIA